MDAGWARVRDDPVAEHVWQRVLEPIATEMGAGAPELAEHIIGRLEAERPDPNTDALAIEEQRASVTAILAQLAGMLGAGTDPREVDLPTAAVALGRARVQQRVPLAYIMRTYRLAQETLWDWLFEHITAATADATEQAAALQLATSWLFANIDSSLLRAEQIYEQEREAWLASAAAARTEAIEDILADLDAGFRAIKSA